MLSTTRCFNILILIFTTILKVGVGGREGLTDEEKGLNKLKSGPKSHSCQW